MTQYGEMGDGKSCGKLGSEGKCGECTKSEISLDGETSKYFYILQGVAQGCTVSPTLFKVLLMMIDLIEFSHKPNSKTQPVVTK